MLPLMPYNGILRPALMVAFILVTVGVIHFTQSKPWHRKLLIAVLIAYLGFLCYATFLSRKPASVLSYRLSPFCTLREAFALEGNGKEAVSRLVVGDWSWIRVKNSIALEGIALNILMLTPMGYFLPQVFPNLRWARFFGIGFLLTAVIEVGQLLTRLGMFELDDIFYNLIGMGIGRRILKLLSGKRACEKGDSEAAG